MATDTTSISFRSLQKHRAALLAAVLGAFITGGAVMMAGYAAAATKSIIGRGIVREPNAAANTLRVDISLTVPRDEKVMGEQTDLKLSSTTRVLQNLGQTAIGSAVKPVTTKRVRLANVEAGSEVTFRGTYSPGDKDSIRVTEVRVADRSFAVCGTLQGITRRTAAGANLDTLTVEVKKATVQEARYGRFFTVGKDAVFTFKDGTQFHNAAGTLARPTGRVSIQAADITANQQKTGLHGKIVNVGTLEVSTVDLGIRC